jgi:hypothetical protein
LSSKASGEIKHNIMRRLRVNKFAKETKNYLKIISVAPSNTLLISVLNLNDRNEVRSS